MTKFTRKVVALAIAATMILTSMANVVLADNNATYQESANVLKGYGVFVGDNGNLMLDQQLKRQDAVVIALRLMGKADAEFENYDRVSDFTDIADEYYLPVIGMAQDLGLVEGMGDGTFGFDQLITAQQLQTILLRSLGYEITDDIYANVPQMAQELGINNLVSANAGEQITRDIVAQMMLNALNTNVKDTEEKLGVKLGFVEAEPPVEAKDLEIASTSIATDSSIKVTFNRAVADTSKIAFELKGSTTIETTATWSADKKEATLTAPSVLLEGAYTLKVTGEKFVDGKDSATLAVVKNGPAKIEFSSDKLIKDANHAANFKATLNYKVIDNYGVDITKSTLESDLTVASSKALNGGNPFDIDAEKGIMTLTFTGALADTDKTVALTVIATKTGKSASTTLNVSDASKVDAVTLGTIEFAKTTPVTTKVLTGKATAAYIPVDAKDQYGNTITAAAALKEDGSGDILLVKSDANLVLTTEEYTNDAGVKQARLIVDTTGIATAKVVTVTMVSKLAGKSASVTIDIKEPAKADKVSVGAQAGLAAAGDAANTFVLPMTVVDQYGVQLTPDEIVSNVGNITVTGSGALAGKLAIATSGDNKGKIVNTAAIPALGTYVITVTTTTGGFATYTLEVKEAAYEKTIRIANAPAANLLMGATTNMNFKFIDQYGRDIKTPAGTKVTVEVSNTNILKATLQPAVAGKDTGTANPFQTTALLLSADKSLKVETNTTEGNAKVIAKLYDLAGTSVISTVESNITVTNGVPGTLTFEIADIPTLVSKVADGAVDGTDNYARALVITAKDANGVTYAIPTNRILSVTTQDSNLILLSNSLVAGGSINAQEGNYVVAAQDEATAFTANDPATKTATINVVISTDTGVKEIAKTVTVAKEDPKVVKVVFANKDLATGNPYALAKDAKEISDVSGTIAEIDAAKLFVFEVDQYGVYTLVAAPVFKVVNMDKLTVTPTYGVDNTLDGVVANKIKANETVHVMYQAANGVYGTFTVKASDGTL